MSEEAYKTIAISVKDGVANVVFNNPKKRNALSKKTFEEMKAVFESINDMPDVRCVVLSGKIPPRIFQELVPCFAVESMSGI